MEIKTFKNYVGGAWVSGSSGETFEQRNPANLDHVTGRFQSSTVGDTENAIASAQAAFPGWKGTPPIKRAAILRRALDAMVRRKNEIAAVITEENGKTLLEASGEVEAAILELDFQIGEGLRLYGQTIPSFQTRMHAYSVREPLGVVSVICPWNFPFNVPGRKCGPALMAGNTCVLKPANLTPHTGILFTELFEEAGLPKGVLNCVTGAGSTVGETLVTDPRVKAISFTGSTGVGKGIAQKAAINLTPAQLEMGGKNPAVILEDADLDAAVEAVLKAAFACSGQWCTSTSRAIVVKEVAAAFTQRIVDGAKGLRVGVGTDPETQMGPVCGATQRDTILSYIEKGKSEGANLQCGGIRLEDGDYADGTYISPTVFTDVLPAMTIAQEEIFGPVLSIITVDDFEEAIEVANGVPFGLSSSIFTKDIGKAMRFVSESQVGLTHVNTMTSLKEPQLPFGGIKESGFGLPEAGRSGIEFFSEHKVAYIKY